MGSCCAEKTAGCCTVIVMPGESIQAALDSLPETGGCVCLKAGVHEIHAPIRIERSYVTLKGESRGARVVRADGPELLIVADEPSPGIWNDLFGVVIEGISFEVSAAVQTTGNLVTAIRCKNSLLRGCSVINHTAISNTASTSLTGILLRLRCFNFVIEDCLIEAVHFGIRAFVDSVDLKIRRNKISTASGNIIAGVAGILLVDNFGASYIEQNHISGYLIGVSLNDEWPDPSKIPISNADGTRIVENTIERGVLTDVLTIPTFFAIDVGADHCIIDNNTCEYHSYSGIRVTGSASRVSGNSLQLIGLDGVSHGISIGPDAFLFLTILQGGAAVNPTTLGCVSNNQIIGHPVGIFVVSNQGIDIDANHVEGSSEVGAAGISCFEVDRSTVTNNEVRHYMFGITFAEGIRNTIVRNRVSNGHTGLLVGLQESMCFDRNEIDNYSVYGTIGANLWGDTSVSDNRYSHCGYADSLGGSILIGQVLGDLRIDGNSISHAGAAPTGIVTTGVTYGILGFIVENCSVAHNTVELDDQLDPSAEHRALRLQGFLDFQIDLAGGDTGFGFGVCQILGNRFSGPGLSALIEVSQSTSAPQVYQRFNRVTFGYNYCSHISTAPDASKATVKLSGSGAIVTGNHIKATTGIAAADFNNMPGIYSSNMASGSATQFVDFPAPINNYNR